MVKKLTKKRKAEIINSNAYVTITSREIAEMTGKQHSHVLNDIERIANSIGFKESNQPQHVAAARKDQVTDIFYKHHYQVDGKGKKYPMYVLGQFMADMVITSYSDEYRAALLRELYARRNNAHLWNTSRENLRHEHWELTSHIKRLGEPDEEGNVRRDANGKRLVMRYSTELDLMNRIVLGMSAKKFKELHYVKEVRDALTPTRIQIFDRIQKHNTLLLDMDKGYYERKDLLTENYAILMNRYHDQLYAEAEEYKQLISK